MESIQRFTHRLFPIPITGICLKSVTSAPIWTTPSVEFHLTGKPIFRPGTSCPKLISGVDLITRRSHGFSLTARAGWILGLGEKKQILPHIVKAGDPVLHEAAGEVPPEEIGSEKIQKIIDDMVKVMRKAPGVGLAAPQIGIPLKVCSNFQWPINE